MRKFLAVILFCISTIASAQVMIPGVVASSRQTVGSLTPIALWKFEEASGNAVDEINGNNATMTGATYQQTGQVNYCYLFNGTTTYGNIGQPAVLNINPKDDPITIAVWYKSNGGSGYILSKGADDGGARQYSVYSDGVYLNANMSGGTWTTYSSDALADNLFHLIVLTSAGDGNDGHVYIDGTLLGTIPMGTANANSIDILIGARRNSGNTGVTSFLTGSVDELRIYNIELNQTQITALYNDEI